MSASSGILTSVVIPAKNEGQNLVYLLDEVVAALAGEAFEIIVVDDGSTDDTAEVIRAKKAAGMPVRHLRHGRALGQSAAVRSGVLAARGDIVVTMDGDGQNDPSYVPKMIRLLTEAGAATAMVTGERRGRSDGGPKKLASRFANALRRRVLDDGALDSGCGLRAVRREVFLLLPFFDGWHRFIPALVHREGFAVATSISSTVRGAMARRTTASSIVASAASSISSASGG